MNQFAADFFSHGKKSLVKFFNITKTGFGYKVVPAAVTHLVFNMAFFVPFTGVAKLGLKAVVEGEAVKLVY